LFNVTRQCEAIGLGVEQVNANNCGYFKYSANFAFEIGLFYPLKHTSGYTGTLSHLLSA
jgi:hypothetical protein